MRKGPKTGQISVTLVEHLNVSSKLRYCSYFQSFDTMSLFSNYASKGSNPPTLPIRKADLGTGFLRIAAYAARQAEPIESLSISEIHCGSASEGAACVSLLQQSLKWDVDILRLTGSVGELFWEGLATTMAGCKSLEKIRYVLIY